jgi:hypothetical protein
MTVQREDDEPGQICWICHYAGRFRIFWPLVGWHMRRMAR